MADRRDNHTLIAGPRQRRGAGERGSVTAEFAVVMPVVMLVLAMGVGVLELATAQLRCIDAARAAARFAARGEPEPVSLAEGRSLGPDGSQVDVTTSGDRVQVQVRALVRVPLWPPITVRAVAMASLEQP